MSRIKVLRQQKADLMKEAEALTANEDDGEITEDEQTRLEALTADDGEIAKVNARIKREERLMDERRSMETVPDVNADTPEEQADRVEPQPKKAEGFKTLGEQLQAIAYAGMNDTSGGGARAAERDGRLKWAAATGANEAVPSEGGFLVQKDFSTDLLDMMHDMGDLVGRVRRIPLSEASNGMKMPVVDETSRVDGSRWGGVQAYWANEADTVSSKQPNFREMELSLKKLFGLGYATEELLADATALESVMMQAFTEEMTFKTEDAIINGTGAGQPLGILNSGAVISVSAESGQAAATIQTANIVNMFARLPRRSARNAVWLVNQDVWPQLWQLTLGSGTAVTLLYAPPGLGTEAQNAPFGTLLGRPVVPTEYNATLGTAGDIILADLSQYLMIDKGGAEQASSMHVRFIYDEMTFRFIYRVDGQPAWNQPVTPYKGNNTQSPFISLATRS